MNAIIATAKCPCNQCSQKIEFEAEHAGETIQCPHCGMDTVLFIPHDKPAARHAAPVTRRSIAMPSPTAIKILIAVLALGGMVYLAKVILQSDAAQEAAKLVGGGIVAIVVFLFAVIWALLWFLFPVFVYFALEKIKAQLDRSNQLLERISTNTQK